MAPQVGITETLNCKTTIEEEFERGCVLTPLLKHEVHSSSDAELLMGERRNVFAPSLSNLANKTSAELTKTVLPVSVCTEGVGGGSCKRERQDTTHKEQQRKRGCISWEVVTSAADHDGYLWRKYGEKKINNNQFSRCYYRCTYYRDKKCKATKQVQRQNYSDPPLYKVTYFYEHTCNAHVAMSNMQTVSYPQMLDFAARGPQLSCSSASSAGMKEGKSEKIIDACNRGLKRLKLEFGSTPEDELVLSVVNPPVPPDADIDHEIDFGSIWFDSTGSGLSLFGLEI